MDISLKRHKPNLTFRAKTDCRKLVRIKITSELSNEARPFMERRILHVLFLTQKFTYIFIQPAGIQTNQISLNNKSFRNISEYTED